MINLVWDGKGLVPKKIDRGRLLELLTAVVKPDQDAKPEETLEREAEILRILKNGTF